MQPTICQQLLADAIMLLAGITRDGTRALFMSIVTLAKVQN